jgi:hypothetical protein
LRGRWLVLARLAWLAVAVLAVALFVASVPLRYAELQQVCVGAACTESQLTLEDVRSLQSLGLSREFHAAYNVGLEIVFALVHVVIATVIFARRSDDRMALFVALMLLTFGTATFTGTMHAMTEQYTAWRLPVAFMSSLPSILPDWLWQSFSVWRVPVAILSSIGQACAALFFYLFPDGRFVPRWTRVLAAAWIVWQAPAAFFPNSFFNTANWPPVLAGVVWSGFIGSYAFAQVYRYRHVSDPVQRQQSKWVVFGVTAALGGFFGATLLAGIFTSLGQPGLLNKGAINTIIYLSMLLIPLSISAAILRSRLWAIDVIINRTLVYGMLTGTLALIYAASVVLLEQALRAITGQRSNLAIVISTLAIAALFNPLRRRIQDRVDLRFFRHKYDAAKTLAAFSARMRDEVDLSRLTDELLAVVEETMQPAHVSLWLKTPGEFKSERKD